MPAQTRASGWLWTLCATQASVVIVFLNFAGALTLIQSDWQLNNAQAGAINAAGQLGYIVAVLVLSSLTDYVGAERVILGGALWAGFANLGFAMLAHDTPSAIFWRALVGLGVAGIYMPGVRLIAQRVPGAMRGRWVGLFVAAFTLGSAASVALGGGAAAALGWRRAFALMSLGPLAGAFIAWRRLPRSERATAREPASDSRLADLLHNKPALLSIGTYTAHAWEVLGLRSWLPAFLTAVLTQTGVGLAAATRTGAALAGIATLAGAAATASSGAISDRLGRTRTIKIVMGASFISVLGLGFTLDSPWTFVIVLSLVATFLTNADSAVISTTLTETVPTKFLGRTLAVYSFSGFTAGAIAPIVFGAVLDYARSGGAPAGAPVLSVWSWAFATLAMASLVGLFAVSALQRQLQRRRRMFATTDTPPLPDSALD